MIADAVGIIDHIEHIDCISIKAFSAGVPPFTFELKFDRIGRYVDRSTYTVNRPTYDENRIGTVCIPTLRRGIPLFTFDRTMR